MTEDEELKQRQIATHAQRLRALTQFPEFKEFLKIAEDIYEANASKLIAKEDPEARGICRGIELIFAKCFDDIKFGENVLKELWERRIK